jgi:hypothetical protein
MIPVEVSTDLIGIPVTVSSDILVFDMDPAAAIEVLAGDTYKGDYVAITRFSDQVFETKDKTMNDDFVVKEIPCAEVTNPAGGLTLTIGG